MKKKLIIIAAVLALGLMVAVPAISQVFADDDNPGIAPSDGPAFDDESILDFGPLYAQGFDEDNAPGMPAGGGGMHGGMGMMADLDLTKDQQKQFHDLTVNFRKEMIPMRAQVQVMRIELNELIRANASQSDVDKKIDQISVVRTNMAKKMAAQRLAMRKILTQEQRDKWDARPMMGRGMGQGMGRGMQGMREMIKQRMQKRGNDEKGL